MKKGWFTDTDKKFSIDQKGIAKYFDRWQVLNFDKEKGEAEEEAIRPYIDFRQDLKVLDLGCGNGRWGEILIPKAKLYVGVDFSKKFIDAAQRKYQDYEQAEFHCEAAQNYRDNRKFNLIMVVGLITYMDDHDVKQMADNCRSLLTDDGKLILRNVSLNSGEPRKVYQEKPGFYHRVIRRIPPYQVIRRNPEEEKELFQGFDLIHLQKIQGTGFTFQVFEK